MLHENPTSESLRTIIHEKFMVLLNVMMYEKVFSVEHVFYSV
jgi:hypothetical protein